MFFLEPHFGMTFGAHFGDFGSLLGSLLETTLVTVWVPFLHRFLDPQKNIKKGGAVLTVLSLMVTLSPLLGLLPPS